MSATVVSVSQVRNVLWPVRTSTAVCVLGHVAYFQNSLMFPVRGVQWSDDGFCPFAVRGRRKAVTDGARMWVKTQWPTPMSHRFFCLFHHPQLPWPYGSWFPYSFTDSILSDSSLLNLEIFSSFSHLLCFYHWLWWIPYDNGSWPITNLDNILSGQYDTRRIFVELFQHEYLFGLQD